jgi:HAE1 family hydrophobic/amphiphilic exporter-1
MTGTYPLPIGYNFKEESEYWSGNEDDDKQLMILLGFAIMLVYMALASLFESFKYPFIILLILPLAFIGVTLIYLFTDETFTTYANFGLILLAGIVVNNSIIMVFRINQLRDHGIERDDSILQAVRDRFRPIVMTSLTTILGLIPMLFKGSDKIDFWRLLSLSTIGGMIASTFFVLTFVPILYRILSGRKWRREVVEYKRN